MYRDPGGRTTLSWVRRRGYFKFGFQILNVFISLFKGLLKGRNFNFPYLLKYSPYQFFLTSLLEYNCFTMLCQFLLYNKVNQLYIYIYHLIPSLSHPSRWTQSTELISLCYGAASHQLSVLHLVVYICPCHTLTSSQLTLPPPCHILFIYDASPHGSALNQHS